MSSVPWSRRAVLSLYRALMREGEKLEYTDREFFKMTLRREFEKGSRVVQPEQRQKLLDKGHYFLSKGLGGLV